MTNPNHTDTSRSGDLVERRYLLVKRGLYYAPDNCGYTGIKDRAGRYFASDAGNETVAIHEDEAPAFSSACWEDVKVRHLSDRIEAIEAENERLRGLHWTHLDAEPAKRIADAIEAGEPFK